MNERYCERCEANTEHETPNSVTAMQHTYYCTICGTPN